MSDSFLFKELSYSVIGAAFRVHSTLGCGLPEPSTFLSQHSIECCLQKVLYNRADNVSRR